MAWAFFLLLARLSPVAASEPVERRETLGAWGVSISLPRAARSLHEAEANRHSVFISSTLSVTLQRVALPAPATLAAANAAWGDEGPASKLRRLGEGTTADGVLWSKRAFWVRVGFPAGPGRTVHAYKHVARVYAVLAVGDAARIECTGYVEQDVETAEDAHLDVVWKICASMRRE